MADGSQPALSSSRLAAEYIEQHGLALVKLPPGQKHPMHRDWQQPSGHFTDAAEAAEFFAAHPDWGMGAVLGPSRLCSLDIDNLTEARTIFSEFGIEIDEWADRFPSIVGNPERFRIMFRAPEGVELSRRALQWPDRDDPKRSHTVFELRAGLVQDALPPTLHPDTGRPYYWRQGPTNGFPELPAELLTHWLQWDVFKANARALCSWAPDAPTPPPTAAKPRQGGELSVIEAYCNVHDIRDALERHDYKRVGKRYVSPHSKTGIPGVTLIGGNRCYIHHASDPLGGERPVNPFDLFCHYDHGDDLKAATRAAARLLGIAHKSRAGLRAVRQARQAEWFDPTTGEIFDHG